MASGNEGSFGGKRRKYAPRSPQANRAQQRRHKIPPLVGQLREFQRHGDRGLALTPGDGQGGKIAVQDQVTDVRLVGREAGEPNGDIEVRLEVGERAVLVGVDDWCRRRRAWPSRRQLSCRWSGRQPGNPAA